MGIAIFCLNLVKVLIFAWLQLLLLRGALDVTVAILMTYIDSLSILRAMPRLSRVLMRLASLALASERALLCRGVPRAAINRASLILVHLVLLVVAFLSLEALEVGVLASTNFVLL